MAYEKIIVTIKPDGNSQLHARLEFFDSEVVYQGNFLLIKEIKIDENYVTTTKVIPLERIVDIQTFNKALEPKPVIL